MDSKSGEKYIFSGILIGITVFIIFCPTQVTIINNETMFSTIAGLKVQDGSIFTALIVGIGTILIALYNTEKTFKAMKLTSIPDKSANLLIDLEFEFNEYGIYKQNKKDDEIILFIQILKYWKKHQKAFRLLAPKFYKNFVKLISSPEIIKDEDDNFEKNSKYIINAILTQITNIALENENDKFYFIDPNKITDKTDIKTKGSMKHLYKETKISKTSLKNYIDNIKGEETKNATFIKFQNFCKEICCLLNYLKIEIEEYD